METDFWVLVVVGGALALAAMLYFVVLPHAEGPSPADQLPDRKAWLVACPNCGRWQSLEPFSSEEQDVSQLDAPAFANWYRCPHCDHRWVEQYRR